MKEYERRKKNNVPLKMWWSYWSPCECGHLSHAHKFDDYVFGSSMFNCLRRGMAWVQYCNECECPRFKKGDIKDLKLIEKIKQNYGYIWGFVP